MVIHDTDRPEWRPLLNVMNQLVWSADGRGVHTVLVDGKKVDLWDAVLEMDRVPVALLIGVVGLMIAPAYMCCLLPGAILGACVYQWPMAALDRSTNAMDAVSYTHLRAHETQR